MAQSISVLIHKLQKACNLKFDAHILLNRNQFYSESQKRPITMYSINTVYYDEERGKNRQAELFKSASQVHILKFLRDYWFELNDKELPYDPEWQKVKQRYLDKL